MLRSIKELEFDHAMRKTADADYEEMRDRLRVRAVGLMQQLDAAGYRDGDRTRPGRARRPARRGRRPPDVAPPPSARRLRRAARPANDADARFCKQCGAPLAGAG